VSGASLLPFVQSAAVKGAVIHTDGWSGYSGLTAAEACSSTGSLSKPSPSDRPRTTPSSATLILPGRPPHWSEGDTLLSKKNEKCCEDGGEIDGNIIRISDGHPDPATKTARDHAGPLPAMMFFGAFLCAIVGLWLVGFSSHTFGILIGISLLVPALILGALPYHLRSADRRSEDVRVLPVIITKLEFGNEEWLRLSVKYRIIAQIRTKKPPRQN
jgi:hypothetical protein